VKILILGSGGREHAIAWKCAQDPRVETIFVAPGNAGTATEAKCENVAIDILDNNALVEFAKAHADLTIVGPEAPLVNGVVNAFQAAGLKIWGPTQFAAQLEGSKAFAKDFLARHNIPSAEYAVFTDVYKALTYLRERGAPIVIKADGLAAGKGVIVAMSQHEAEAAVIDMLADNKFGAAGARVVIEEFLDGEEASFICMVDGLTALPMATSQDHKRIGDGDSGPNTGGMGAYSPAPVVTPEVHERIMREVINPTVAGMAAEGHPYTGFLYAGLMISKDGKSKVIEFNCRFGDPETQPVLIRLHSSFPELIEQGLAQNLANTSAEWDERAALGVVMAAEGYPGEVRKGDVISGLPTEVRSDAKIFHAGTTLRDGQVVTSGGRVLCATAMGKTVSEAQTNAYTLLNPVYWNGEYHRKDIGYRAVARERGE
jgi:phosphoribosylamine--glycine ligase